MDAKIDGCTLSGLDNLLLNLAAHFAYHFFYTGRVNTAVSHELVKGEARYLATHRIKAREDNRLGGVIHDDLNAGSSLKSANITTLSTDYTTLDLITVDMEHSHRILYCGLRGKTLYRLHDYTLSLLVGCHLRLVHYVMDICCGSSLCLILETFYKLLLCLLA